MQAGQTFCRPRPSKILVTIRSSKVPSLSSQHFTRPSKSLRTLLPIWRRTPSTRFSTKMQSTSTNWRSSTECKGVMPISPIDVWLLQFQKLRQTMQWKRVPCNITQNNYKHYYHLWTDICKHFTMFKTVEFPGSVPHLDSSLSNVDAYHLPLVFFKLSSVSKIFQDFVSVSWKPTKWAPFEEWEEPIL